MSTKDAESATLMMQNLSILRDEPTFSDMVVIVGDSEFPCHRAILAAASDFFMAAFTNDMKEAREEKITLHGVDKNLFETLLDFIYRGKYILTEENLFEIWAASDLLQVKVLISECDKLMRATLSTKNAITYLTKVRDFGSDAKQHVLEFICKNLNSNDIYYNNKLMQKDEMKAVIGSENIQISEDGIIGFMLRWAEENISEHQEKGSNNSHNQSDDKESRESISECLAELLESSRYFLISENCLYGTLMTHPLVKGNKRCEAIVLKILWYQSQFHIQQSWIPPPAIHRHNTEMVNVLMICKVKVDDNFQLSVLNLRNMEWKKITLRNCERRNMGILCYDSRIYTIYNNNTSLYLPHNYSWQHCSLDVWNKFIRIIGKNIYLYDFQTERNTLEVTHVTNSAQLGHILGRCNYFLINVTVQTLTGMFIKEVTSMGNTQVVFFGRDNLDNYSILLYNPVRHQYNLHSDQLGSRSKLVTFSHEKEVFVLQENGRLWRMRQDKMDQLDMTITQELVLWDGEISLTGAVLYNDELLIVGEFPDQIEGFPNLERSLDGIFKSVRKIKSSQKLDNKLPRVCLSVLPASMIE